MEMDLLLKRVGKELETIADKGISSSNLDSTYKLIDIYKDIKEINCMDEKGSYNDKYYIERYNRGNDRSQSGDYNTHYPLDERHERYLTRMKEGMSDYNAGRMRYRDGGSEQRMIDGIEMTMSAIINFVESLIDYSETPQEKEIVRKYINKLKNV